MPTDPIQLALAAFEISLVLFGVILLGRFAFSTEFRARWWHANRLPHWSVAPAEFALYLLAIFVGGFVFQSLIAVLFGKFIAASTDQDGLKVFLYGTGLDGGGLIGWLLFPFLKRSVYANYGVSPAVDEPAVVSPPSWGKSVIYGISTIALSYPAIIVLGFGWAFILRSLGLPEDPQDSIAIFSNTKSHVIVTGMLLVACVLAPIMEELLFRAGLYRFCRQRLGRTKALLISGIVFGMVHGNWAGFLPLAFLGAMLAMVYETTGSIRVAIIAHAFFNLNSVLAILSGLKM